MAISEDKNKRIDQNIVKQDKCISNALEKRLFHIIEKADNNFEGDEILLDDVCSRYSTDNDCIEENKEYISCVQNSINLYDKLLIADKYGNGYSSVFSKNDDDFISTVVYLKNPLSDIAYSVFSKILKDARVLYEESFVAVCEAVYYNRAPYCILPIENYEDGRLTGFINMIRKYELKIVLTCNVESANGKITKFALLQREIAKIDCNKKISDGQYLEISFRFGEQSRLHEILAAAMFFGYKLNKIDSLPVYYSEKEYYFDVVFSGDGYLEKFLYWLDFEFPRYEILGLYTHIKTL